MTATPSEFDPADWLARAAALGRRVEVVGRVVYFGPRPRGREAEDDRLFAELRAAGGVAAIRGWLRLAGPTSLLGALSRRTG